MNRNQLAALAILPKISSTLSILGSAAIISECLYFDRSLIKRVMNRVLCVMAIFDILESIWNFASTWAMPGNHHGHGDRDLDMLFTIGNDYTCTIQGFFLQLGVTIPILNAFLSVYYLLVIKFSWTEEDIREKAERWFYGVSVAFGLITSIAAIPLDLYHPCEIWCWIGESESNEDTKYRLYRTLFYFGPLVLCFVVIASNMVIIVWTVLSLETISNKYSTQSYANIALGPNKINRVKALTTKYILKRDEARKASRREVSQDIPDEKDGNGQINSLNPSHDDRIKELMRKLESVKDKSSKYESGQTSNSEIGRILELKKITHQSGNSQATDRSRILALREDKKSKSSNKDTIESLTASSQRSPNTPAVADPLRGSEDAEKSSAECHTEIFKKSPEEMRDLKVSSLTGFTIRNSNGLVLTDSNCKDVEEIPEIRNLQVSSLTEFPETRSNTAALTNSSYKDVGESPAERYLRIFNIPRPKSNLVSSLRPQKDRRRLKRYYTSDDSPDEITMSRRARRGSQVGFNVTEKFESFLPSLSPEAEAVDAFSSVVKSGGFGSLTLKQDSYSTSLAHAHRCSQQPAALVGPCADQNSTSNKCSHSVGTPADPNSTSNACDCCDELQPRNKKKKSKSKSRMVTEQALFYVLSFVVTFTWSIVNRILLFNRKEEVYVLLLGNAFFDPLQGFINYLVYVRPKFVSSRKKYPKKNCFVIIYHLMTHREMMNDMNEENEEMMRSELSEWRSIRDSQSKHSQLKKYESIVSDTGMVEDPLDPASGKTEDTLLSDDDRIPETVAITESCV